jgi:DNA-binding MarR family transcriptional regulator
MYWTATTMLNGGARMAATGFSVEDLGAAVMRTLSSRLSASVSDLSKELRVTDEQLQSVLDNLERDDMIHRVSDSVTGEVLVSPTSRGLVRVRKATNFAL